MNLSRIHPKYYLSTNYFMKADLHQSHSLPLCTDSTEFTCISSSHGAKGMDVLAVGMYQLVEETQRREGGVVLFELGMRYTYMHFSLIKIYDNID